MYSSLFFGEPSQAFYRAERSFMVSKTKPKWACFSKLCKSHDIEFYNFNRDNKDPNKFGLNFYLNKYIIGAMELIMTSPCICIQANYDEVPVFLFKTDIDPPPLTSTAKEALMIYRSSKSFI